jgi:uncharacterized membrane protein YeiB
VAGISIAFMSGGRHPVEGRARTAASAGLAVRAALIGLIGLLLAVIDPDVDVILTAYALAFLLAIPLLGLRPRQLALLSAVLVAVGPVVLVALARAGVGFSDDNPTFGQLVTDPLGLLLRLLITGEYPVLLYLALMCAGLAIGRLDLTSRRVAGYLIGGGIGLAVVSRLASLVLLYPLGGLARLVEHEGTGAGDVSPATTLLWAPEQGSSWWYLALPSPHAHSTLDMVHVLGSALAVVGVCLLLTRASAVRRLLSPVQAAGAMTLTLYSAHILVMESGFLEDERAALYLAMVVGSLLFAVLWRRWQSQGPLEWVVARAAGRARLAVLGSSATAVGKPERD